MDELLYEVEDGVAYMTFNRPEARNSLTDNMYGGIVDFCARAENDKDVRVLVLRGAGEKAFTSGADINQFLASLGDEDSSAAYRERSGKAASALETFPKPLIAAVNGACAGGGMGIAAACDLRVGTASARLGLPIAKTLGNCVGANMLVRIASIIGASKTVELVFTARLISGTEAKELGFFNELVQTSQELDERVRGLAKHIAQLAPLTLAATKEQVRRLRDAQISQVNFDDLSQMCFSSKDFKNAVESFVAKRPPVWEGR